MVKDLDNDEELVEWYDQYKQRKALKEQIGDKLLIIA